MKMGDNGLDFSQYRQIPYEVRDCCSVCECKSGGSIIAMPQFPITEIYVDKINSEKFGYLDQEFNFCSHCGHAQLVNVIDVNLQYGDSSDYFFRSSQSETARETMCFFADFFHRITGGEVFGTIVEIGCNDLFLLESLKDKAENMIGVDPILKGREEEFMRDNITVVGDFFENTDLGLDVDIVLCKDTLEHVRDPKQFLKKIIGETSDKTLFFFQFPLLEALLVECRFDQVFHQHLNYFSLRSITYLLEELGCNLLDYTVNYDHWGSILIAFKKKCGGFNGCVCAGELIDYRYILNRYDFFQSSLHLVNEQLEFYGNDKLYGYGAALMFPVLSYWMKNDLTCLECLIDDDEKKDGLYYVNSLLPIVHRSRVENFHDSIVLMTAVFSKLTARRLLENLIAMKPKGIIIPLALI